MRTIQIVNVRWFNATAWYGMELARLLNNSGHETLTLGLGGTLSFAKAQSMNLNPIALPLTTNNPLEIVRLTRKLAHIIHDFRPDVINCHRGESFILFGMLKKFGHYALVRTRGDQRLPKNNIVNRVLHQHVADAVIATNSVMAQHFEHTIHVSKDRLHTIIGGVDRNIFRFTHEGRHAIRNQLGFTPEHQVIGLLGRFDRVKGQKELIEAVARLLHAGNKNIRLLLAGFPTATTQAEVESWIHTYNMEPYTVISGKVENVASLISAMDIGVVASLWSETIARAALEIMSCGRPLVSTSVGVMPDLLPSDALCPPSNVSALTHLLNRTLSDKTFCNYLTDSENQRMKTLGNNDFLTQTLAVYDKAIAHAKRT